MKYVGAKVTMLMLNYNVNWFEYTSVGCQSCLTFANPFTILSHRKKDYSPLRVFHLTTTYRSWMPHIMN